ncbi:hypothetical protein [Tumebacillus permanentifrigoris]|uniref:Uncharacterized protein n=1 Tax=Tumebacillus permanentifrigoris TaxID=378543 RepID=A0A316D650_9BACL|nr:hypothetical protein [Tumebacillus permanentifrigoris]PWK10210.1 hypothetical protein C7459_11231 [Tumebacillus permanentifrigoris]
MRKLSAWEFNIITDSIASQSKGEFLEKISEAIAKVENGEVSNKDEVLFKTLPLELLNHADRVTKETIRKVLENLDLVEYDEDQWTLVSHRAKTSE